MDEVRRMLMGQNGRVSFHMPGHKGRIQSGWADTTELPITDDLNEPKGAYLALESTAALLYGAKSTIALVGGSSLGVKAMLLGAVGPKDAVIMPRSAHQSAFFACVIGDIRPIFVFPGRDEENDADEYIEEDFLRAMRENPQAKAVFLVRPDYYGRCLPLERIARLAAELSMRLIVDEAHGAHLAFVNGPKSAGAWADAWCQSLHKTLPALTQTALLHLKSGEDEKQTRDWVRLLQTSSPSSLLALSIEDALSMMQREGRALHEGLLERMDAFKKALAKDGRYRVNPFLGMDPCRLVIDVRGTGRSGFWVQKELEKQGIDLEMADWARIVGIPSIMNTEEDFRALSLALLQLEGSGTPAQAAPRLFFGEPALSLREAWFMQKEFVPIQKAQGRIAGRSMGLYPPGVPLALPGERITKELAQSLLNALEAGGNAFGIGNKGEAVCVITQ